MFQSLLASIPFVLVTLLKSIPKAQMLEILSVFASFVGSVRPLYPILFLILSQRSFHLFGFQLFVLTANSFFMQLDRCQLTLVHIKVNVIMLTNTALSRSPYNSISIVKYSSSKHFLCTSCLIRAPLGLISKGGCGSIQYFLCECRSHPLILIFYTKI